MNLRAKFLLWTTSLVALVVTGIGTLTVLSEARLMKHEMDRHQDLTVQRLAKVCEETLYQGDVVLFNYFETLKAERGFLAAAFLDSQGKIQARSENYPEESDASQRVLTAPVHYGGSPVGTARLILSEPVLQNHIRQTLTQTIKRIGLILILALFIGFLGALILTQSLISPIQEIVKGMKEVSKGRLDPLALTERKDELGWLGNEINTTIGKLRELDEIKRNFFSRVTHDLRSPLIGIQGLVSLLLKGQFGTLTTESREALVDVNNFSARLTALIDDLLTTAKLEAGREEVELEDFDVREAVEEISKFYRPVAQEKNIPLLLELPTTEAVVHADKEKTIHVLTNLVSNAYKFTKEGHVAISVKNTRNKVEISVADTGVGIPDKEKSKVFDRFYRVESTKKVKGSGLGLFIVKSLLELQKGNISVGSNQGKGTLFTFTLPKTPSA